jgi:hypothetical protein
VDLSFARLDRQVGVTAMPTELAVLLVGIAVRQATSPTACIQARLDVAAPVDRLLAPRDGAFHGPAAVALTRRKQE